jgi:formylglycine-generating enzyme
MIYRLIFGSLILVFCARGFTATDSERMVLLPKGEYLPFYPIKAKERSPEKTPVQVERFWMDELPVTNSEFLDFVKENHRWQKSEVKHIFADSHYLENWKSDLELSKKAPSRSPVVFVSWFAAKAFCESRGKSLPSTDQWEYAAYDEGKNEKQVQQRALDWFSRPNDKVLSNVGGTAKNGFGVYDLQGLIWEWTGDFNSPLGGGDNAFCGNSALGASKPSDYVSYMRYAFRSSLKGNYTIGNLGFRCVRSVEQ